MSKLLVLSLILDVASSACPEHGMAYKDSFFPTPNGAFLADWQACQKSCELSPTCEVFTFKKSSTPPGGCWLLPKSAAAETDGDAISGPKACPEENGDSTKAVGGSSVILGAAAAPAAITGLPAAAAASLDALVSTTASPEEVSSTTKTGGMGQGMAVFLLVAIIACTCITLGFGAYQLHRRGVFRTQKRVSRGLPQDTSEAEEDDEESPAPRHAPAAVAVHPPTGYLTPASYPTTPMLTASMAPGAGLQLAESSDPRQMLLQVPQYYAQPSTVSAVMPGTLAAVPGALPTQMAMPQGSVLEPVTAYMK